MKEMGEQASGCKHADFFVSTAVNPVEIPQKFMVLVRLACANCGKKFIFDPSASLDVNGDTLMILVNAGESLPSQKN